MKLPKELTLILPESCDVNIDLFEEYNGDYCFDLSSLFDYKGMETFETAYNLLKKPGWVVASLDYAIPLNFDYYDEFREYNKELFEYIEFTLYNEYKKSKKLFAKKLTGEMLQTMVIDYVNGVIHGEDYVKEILDLNYEGEKPDFCSLNVKVKYTYNPEKARLQMKEYEENKDEINKVRFSTDWRHPDIEH